MHSQTCAVWVVKEVIEPILVDICLFNVSTRTGSHTCAREVLGPEDSAIPVFNDQDVVTLPYQLSQTVIEVKGTYILNSSFFLRIRNFLEYT